MVVRLHAAIQAQDEAEIERLHHLVVEQRKPARLWPEINGQFSMLKISMGTDAQTTLEKITYSRYPEGYNFTTEREARIVTTESNRDVHFDESDVLAIIAPDDATKELVKPQLAKHWSTIPHFFVFPT